MNVCIVGFGTIAVVHAEALRSIDNIKLYGICDIIKERADNAANKYNCKAFYNFDECVTDENVDCIHICTPHYLHFEMIKKTIENGKKVVVEKPVVMSSDELENLYKNYSDFSIYPIIQNRTNSSVIKLKNIIENDSSIGKLISSRGILTWSRDETYYNADEWRGTKAYEGGGVLINQAVHTLDLMIYLGGNIKNITASMSNKSLKGVIEVEDTVDALFEYENGAKGIFYATNAYSESSPVFLEFRFENALFRYADGKLYKNNELICEDEKNVLGKLYWGAGHERTFVDLYENNKFFSLDDIKNTMQTMFAIYESATKDGCEISVCTI